MPEPATHGEPTQGLMHRAFSRTEWRLLTRLPGRVLAVAAAAGDHSAEPPARAVACGLAGLDAIAAGLAFDSDLVRAVAAAIYTAEEPRPGPAGSDDDGVAGPAGTAASGTAGAAGPTATPTTPGAVLADCRRVVRILRERADPADAASYRHWVQSVAARACRAAATADPPSSAGERADAFLDRLGGALGLR